MEKKFEFTPDFSAVATPETRERKKSVAMTVVGSPEKDPTENKKELGKYLAEVFRKALERAKSEGKRLVFDMPTGSTPETLWPVLQQMVADGGIDISDVIVIGHEEAWGSYVPGSHADFDHYRRQKFFKQNSIPVRAIADPRVLQKEDIDGNYIPMHLDDDPEKAAQLYGTLLAALRKRDDVTFLGFYGVGVDGHIGEMQMGALGIEESRQRKKTYVDTVEDYSFESAHAQLFRWQDAQGNFRSEDNVFWERGAHDAVGRAARDDYQGIDSIVGIGWKEMLDQEQLVLALNDKNKQLAFTLAVEGSFSGNIVATVGEERVHVEHDRGEGEGILPDLQDFAQSLEKKGILKLGTSSQTCGPIFSAIYQALDAQGATVVQEEKYYQELWYLLNRYIGKRAPVARLIRMRTLLGKQTELVFTPEVVQGTRYESLLH